MYSQLGEKRKGITMSDHFLKSFSYCDDSYPVNETFGGDIEELYVEFRTNLRRQVTLFGSNLMP